GAHAGLTLTPATAASFTVTGFPSPSVAGTAGGLTVTAKDAFGNLATGYVGTVHFTSTDAQAALPANYAYTPADAGVHSFTATLKTAGTQSITAADTIFANTKGAQTGISVTAAAPSKFGVSGFPSPATAGVAGTFTVTSQDAFGNLSAGYTGTVHFTSSDPAATLPGNYTFTAADNGVHTFTSGATLFTSGSRTLTPTDTA